MTMRQRWSGVHRGVALVLLVVVAGAVPAITAAPPAPVVTPVQVAYAPSDHAEHLYTIAGKVRFLFFWMSADDVGGARVTWHRGEHHQIVSLLIGSEPRRAPRAVNEWGYVREAVAGDSTTIFGVRTITDGDSPDEAEARRAQSTKLAEFGVLCSTVSSSGAESRTTTVDVPRDVTYRDCGRVLDVLERGSSWKQLEVPRPPGVAPGFLTALDQMMRSSAAAAGEGRIPRIPGVAYVYKDAVYDLVARRVQRVPQLRTHSRTLQNLLRTDLSIRNRSTGSTTEFRVTYGTEGPLSGIPVYAQYQPNWWFKVELELDDRSEAPEDPASALSFRQRIDALCGSASK